MEPHQNDTLDLKIPNLKRWLVHDLTNNDKEIQKYVDYREKCEYKKRLFELYNENFGTFEPKKYVRDIKVIDDLIKKCNTDIDNLVAKNTDPKPRYIYAHTSQELSEFIEDVYCGKYEITWAVPNSHRGNPPIVVLNIDIDKYKVWKKTIVDIDDYLIVFNVMCSIANISMMDSCAIIIFKVVKYIPFGYICNLLSLNGFSKSDVYNLLIDNKLIIGNYKIGYNYTVCTWPEFYNLILNIKYNTVRFTQTIHKALFMYDRIIKYHRTRITYADQYGGVLSGISNISYCPDGFYSN